MSIKPSIGGPSAPTRGKSSYSASDSNDCVEIAVLPEATPIRDSKDIARDHLAVNPAAWAGFVRYAAGWPGQLACCGAPFRSSSRSPGKAARKRASWETATTAPG
ncbi:DUF397 domain-containing protein [Streptomyces sp. G1]|uniref:DUF397 domain-containing protein n=2 Tax=unclassified Streptomyces TaxID=2593676 RepID=UPI0027E53046|nr:DUF397 domain-containing protein [Streptomyces sp. G1]